MTTAVLFGSFALLLILSVPIGIAIGLATLVTILYSGNMPLEFLAKEMVTSVDSFPLLAVPFFILAGEIMGKGGISERLFRVANALVGNKTGGFAIATIITCMFFAAISGSGPATVAAIGGVMIPAMVQQGYDRRFATATVAAAARWNHYSSKYSDGNVWCYSQCIGRGLIYFWDGSRDFGRFGDDGLGLVLFEKNGLQRDR